MLLTSHFDNSIYADISRKSHPEFTVAGRDLSGARPLPVSHPSYLERTRPALVPPLAPQRWGARGLTCTSGRSRAGPDRPTRESGAGRGDAGWRVRAYRG